MAGCNYKTKYKKYFNIGDQDILMCEFCKRNIAADIHHIIFRSQCGTDDLKNLIALCRECHTFAHMGYGEITRKKLLKITKNRKKLNQ